MTIANFLTLIGILVSIVFSFFVTHFYSIRDTRTRIIKDYYIEQVKAIKVRIDHFFHAIAFKESSFNEVINWYGHLNIDVIGIDKGVRKLLDLHIDELVSFIDKYYGEITNWEDFNDQYRNSKYVPTIQHEIRLKNMKSEVDEFLNNYIGHLNESNCYPIWKVQYRRIKENYLFYKKNGMKFPFIRSICERFEKHFWEILIFLTILGTSAFLIKKVDIKPKNELVDPLNKISNKQDSIYQEFKRLREKYNPVNVQSKTFNNSSFFHADQVDSVDIKLYQGKPGQ